MLSTPAQRFAQKSGYRIRRPNFVDAQFAEARLALIHENFNISGCSSSHGNRRQSSARGRGRRSGPRAGDGRFTDWLSVPALPAFRKTERARDSISLHGNSGWPPIFGDWTDLRSC